MKKILMGLMSLVCAGAMAQEMATSDMVNETAETAIRRMRLGWNLGNTLDSNSGSDQNLWIEHWTGRTPNDYETSWGQPQTKRELIQMMKDAGFNAIRVPVTWWPHMVRNWKFSSSANSIWDRNACPMEQYVDAAWMTRVKEVVDYVIDAGMYCILNVHHDTGDATTGWIKAGMENYEQNHELFEYLWRTIAEEFKDYDHHLLFEGYNEMLDKYGSWCFATFNTSSRYDAAGARDAYDGLNHYAQSFVNTVRATGGNNVTRNLIVNPYAASCGDGNWSSHLPEPLTEMLLPQDVVEGHLLFEVHYYPSFDNLNAGKSNTNSVIKTLAEKLVSKGAPVIVGEWGSGGNVGYDKNRDVYLQWVEYFVSEAKAHGIGTFYWMGLSDGASRSVPEFNQDDLRRAMVKGYYGEGGYDAAIEEVHKDRAKVRCYTLDGRVVSDEACEMLGQNAQFGKKIWRNGKIYVNLQQK